MSKEIADRVYEALSQVWDPELAVDIVSLGLVYDVRFEEDEGIEIDMTLTTPGCPVSDALPSEAWRAVTRALPEHPVRVNIVWDPPWTPERMNVDQARSLGLGRRLRI
ncbi:MAG TPA: metal-sulfur cluster assembly factor [Acidimicrobiia bacterium]